MEIGNKDQDNMTVGSILSDVQELIDMNTPESRFKASGLLNLSKSIIWGRTTIKRDEGLVEFVKHPDAKRFCMSCLHCHDVGAECASAEDFAEVQG